MKNGRRTGWRTYSIYIYTASLSRHNVSFEVLFPMKNVHDKMWLLRGFFFLKAVSKHQFNSVNLHCTGPVAENPVIHISKPGQIKQSLWRDTISETRGWFCVRAILVTVLYVLQQGRTEECKTVNDRKGNLIFLRSFRVRACVK